MRGGTPKKPVNKPIRLLLAVLLSVITAALCTLVHRAWYRKSIESALTTQTQEVLKKDPLFEKVTTKFDYLDASLHGTTTTLDARETARKLSDDVFGARALESNNHITVPSWLFLKRQAQKAYVLTGLAPAASRDKIVESVQKAIGTATLDSSAFSSHTAVLGDPGFSVAKFDPVLHSFLGLDTPESLDLRPESITIKGVGKEAVKTDLLKQSPLLYADAAPSRVHLEVSTPAPVVVVKPVPPPAPVPAPAPKVSNEVTLIQSPDKTSWSLSGVVPDITVRESLVASLKGTVPDLSLNVDNLKTDVSAAPFNFLGTAGLGDFFASFFKLGNPHLLAWNSDRVTKVEAGTVAPLWNDFTAKGQVVWPDVTIPTSGVKFYPSLYHMPGYRMESAIDETLLQKVRDALALANIYFESGSSEISTAEMAKLDAAAAVLKIAGPTIKYVIGGHTDSTGDAEANIKLSKVRATAVKDVLVARGVSADQLQIVSFGASRALDDSDTEESKRLSRRVEILVK